MGKNPKLTVATVLTFILTLWEVISPSAELIMEIGTKGMAIISLVITVISFAYNYFYPNESLIMTAAKHIGIRPKKKPRD